MTNLNILQSRGTILVRIGLIGVICVCVVAGTTSYRSHLALRDAALAGVTEEADLVTGMLVRQFAADASRRGADPARQALDEIMSQAAGTSTEMALFDPAGVVVAAPTGVAETAQSLRDLAQSVVASKAPATSEDGLTLAQPILDASGGLLGVVATGWTTDGKMQAINESQRLTYAIALAAAAIVFGMSLWLIRSGVARPLRNLSQSIRDVTENRLDQPIAGTERRDEIGDISRHMVKLRDSMSANEVIRREAVYKGAAFEASSAAMMLVDEGFRISYINPRMSELLVSKLHEFRKFMPDFDPKNVIGKQISAFHDQTNDARIQRALVASSSATFNTNMTLGETRLKLSVNAVRGQGGEVTGYVVEWDDVTEDWLNGAVLEAIDTAQPRAEFDHDGQYVSGNARFFEAIGRSAQQMTSMRLQSLLVQARTDEMAPEALVRHVLTNKAHIGLLHLRTGGGEELIIDSILTCVRDHAGKPYRLLLVGKDVTRAQRALADAEKEREALTQQQDAVVDALRVGLRQLSNGDLTAKISVPFAGSYEQLRTDYNQTVETLSSAVREIIDNAENIKEAARDISTTTDGLSRRTESTAATLEQTAAALDVLTASVTSAAEGAAQADRVVSEAKVNAEQSGTVVVETVSAMDLIAASSDKITSIIKVIDDIAFQTNLLALNAGVEAARAGDAGRGFAVVASEVRALAQRSSDAAREINDLIAKSGTQVKRGVELVGHTGEALKGIVASVSNISSLVSEIAVSSRQQSTGLAEINTAVNELDQSTQQNAARLEETTAASDALTNDAVALVATVSHFKIEGKRAEPAKVVGFQKKGRPAAPAPRAASATGTTGSGAMGPRRTDFEERSSAGWEDF